MASSASAQEKECQRIICEDFDDFSAQTGHVTLPGQYQTLTDFLLENLQGNNQYYTWWNVIRKHMYNLNSQTDEYLWTFPLEAVAMTITFVNSGQDPQIIWAQTTAGQQQVLLDSTIDDDGEAALRRHTHCFESPATELHFPSNTTGNEVFINSICIVTTAQCE